MHVNPIDVTVFEPVSVTDTCAVWNVLSSKCLYSAAVAAKCEFPITGFVQYECLLKPRKSVKANDTELQDRMRREQKAGRFPIHTTTIADLQHIAALEERKRLGLGEISSIALAMKTGQAVMTDDQNARKLAQASGHRAVQTTPHLFGWLVFGGKLADSDQAKVMAQHAEMGGDLGVHLGRAYDMACRARWGNAQGLSPPPLDTP